MLKGKYSLNQLSPPPPKKYLKNLRNNKGFTMIEMMVVLIIIAVLIGGGIRFYLGYIENAKVTKAKGNISTMQAGMDGYYVENAEYPTTDAKLLNAGIDGAFTENIAELTTKDPWGKTYKIKVTGTNVYSAYTGENKVQGKDNTYVRGEGTDGKSDPPVVVTTATP
ncbi:MAG TPA: hypothetical protein DD719_03930 [Desulfotomaculum sp.]|nr:hypothetical protein [Desulfotomaculum sp.]